MKTLLQISSIILLLSFLLGTKAQVSNTKQNFIQKLEMNLSAFGVEADDFPSIKVFIDFTKDSSYCATSYYNPEYKGKEYKLSNQEINRIADLLNKTELNKLKTKYTCNLSDQPSSTTIIQTSQQKYIIEDYGLLAEEPLKEIYKIVYKY